MFKNDFIMDEIDNISRFLIKLIKKEEIEQVQMDKDGNLSEESFLHYRLTKLLGEKKINEAEDLLFETIETNPDRAYLKPALDFYDTLKTWNDAQLASCDFSKDEILDGLKELSRIYVGI